MFWNWWHSVGLLYVAWSTFAALFPFVEEEAKRNVYNDMLLHRVLVQHTIKAVKASGGVVVPFDFNVPNVGLGFPLFAHYQHFPHFFTACVQIILSDGFGVATMTPEGAADFFALAMIALMPLAVFSGLCCMGFSAEAAAGTAFLYVLINDKPPSQNKNQGVGYSYGIGWNSQLHYGHGLWTQGLACLLFLPAVGLAYSILTRPHARGVKPSLTEYVAAGSLVALTVLSNVFYGYMVAVSIVLAACLWTLLHRQWRQTMRRLLIVGAIAVCTSCYFVVPFLLHRDAVSDVEHRSWKFDSVGLTWVVSSLVSGDLLDYGTGVHGVSLLTWLTAGGLVSSTVVLVMYSSVGNIFLSPAVRKLVPVVAYVTSGFFLHGLVFAGALTMLPFGSQLHMHRFIGGLQFFCLLLVAVLFELCTRVVQDSKAFLGTVLGRVLGGKKRACVSVVRTVAYLFPVALGYFLMHRRAAGVGAMYATVRMRHEKLAGQTRNVEKVRDIVLANVDAGDHGRMFVGLPGYGWNSAAFPSFLQSGRFDILGPTLHTMAPASLYGDWFDHHNRDHYTLFNVEHILMPSWELPPPFPRETTRLTPRNAPIQLYRIRRESSESSNGFFMVLQNCPNETASGRAYHCLHPLLHDAKYGRGYGKGSLAHAHVEDGNGPYSTRKVRFGSSVGFQSPSKRFRFGWMFFSAFSSTKAGHEVYVLGEGNAQGCKRVNNTRVRRAIRGKWVMVQRGGCNFYPKVLQMELAGGTGVIIVDFETSRGMFVAGFGEERGRALTIPVVTMSHEEAQKIKPSQKYAIDRMNETRGTLRAQRPLTLEEMRRRKTFPESRQDIVAGGEILRSTMEKNGNVYKCKFRRKSKSQNGSWGTLVLKVNFHPSWECRFTSAAVKSTVLLDTFRVVPGYLAMQGHVGNGGSVTCVYTVNKWKKAAFHLAFAAVAVVLIFDSSLGVLCFVCVLRCVRKKEKDA
jgi:hypothetical protein